MKKKVLRRMFLNTLVVYPTIYLIKCFVSWGFTNPFQWILEIPTQSDAYRFFVFCGMVGIFGLNAFLSFCYIENEILEND
jgi:hypothetical protein